MTIVKETPSAKNKIKKIGLSDEYKEAKEKFIQDKRLKSLDFCIWDPRLRIWSFKITKKIRVKMIKRPNDEWEVFNCGDFHRRQSKK